MAEFVVSLLSLAVLFGPFAVADTPGECSYDVVTNELGEVTASVTGQECFDMRCFTGNWSTDPEGCERNVQCNFEQVPLNMSCTQRACENHLQTNESSLGRISNRDCSCLYNGVSYGPREVVTVIWGSKCTKIMCSNGHWTHQSWGCVVDSSCYLVGEHFFTNCTIYMCGMRLEPYEYFTWPLMETNCTCIYGGVTYRNGEHFAMFAEDSKCVKVLCDNGVWNQQSFGCVKDSKCYFLGEPVDINCTKYECQRSLIPFGYFMQDISNETYCNANGTCRAVDSEYYMDDCKRYKCARLTDNTVDHQYLYTDCNDNGTCRAVGPVYYLEGCKRYRCARLTETIVYNQYQHTGCNVKGTCRVVDSEYILDGCKRYKCVRLTETKMNNQYLYTGCVDFFGTCHMNASTNVAWVIEGGILLRNCSCLINEYYQGIVVC